MQEYHIDIGPPPRSYGTFAEAITGAEHDPAQEMAKDAGRILEHANVTGGNWSNGACAIHFSNGCLLHVAAHNFELIWRVEANVESIVPATYAPVHLIWKPELTSNFSPLSIIDQIKGSEFIRLYVNELGLLLYTKGNPVLWFHAVRLRESGEDFLFGFLGE